MKFLEQCKKLEYLDYLISMRATGNPKQLAERLNISERTLYNYLNILKEMGGKIEYNPYIESYYYVSNGKLELRFRISK